MIFVLFAALFLFVIDGRLLEQPISVETALQIHNCNGSHCTAIAIIIALLIAAAASALFVDIEASLSSSSKGLHSSVLSQISQENAQANDVIS